MVLAALMATIMILCGSAVAQSTTVKGVITGRTGATMTVQSPLTGNVVVVLSDGTSVDEVEGALHMRKKQMGLTALIPGLPVEVSGMMNGQQLMADSVKFKASDLKTAEDIQAGVTPVVQQQQQQQQADQQVMAKQEAQIQTQDAALQAEQAKVDANKAAIAAANKRFGELGDYNILGEVTVLFGNDKVTVDPEYKPKLQQLAQQAMAISGYLIQVKGYASSVGSAALNQKLSTERADNVTMFLEQTCRIPLTNVLAPGAMGTSRQIAPDTTTEGQAENRRVVVRILQNKGIAGN
jgi:OmpA-OmpF porin, OOP family